MDVSKFWITLEESQAHVPGRLQWWRLESVNQQQVETHQQHALGPRDRPVRVYSNRSMYLGGWKDGSWHGLGILCTKNGQLTIGRAKNNSFTGICKQVWLPQSKAWRKNVDKHSPILSWDYYIREVNIKRTIPFIYIGRMEGMLKCDDFAKVILQDGTTRIGPWRNNRPVGDWWRHSEEQSSQLNDDDSFFTACREDGCLKENTSNGLLGDGNESEIELQLQHQNDSDISVDSGSTINSANKKKLSWLNVQKNSDPVIRRSLTERLFGKGLQVLQQGKDLNPQRVDKELISVASLEAEGTIKLPERRRLCCALSSVMEDFSLTSMNRETQIAETSELLKAPKDLSQLPQYKNASENLAENTNQTNLELRQSSSSSEYEVSIDFQTLHEEEDEMYHKWSRSDRNLQTEQHIENTSTSAKQQPEFAHRQLRDDTTGEIKLVPLGCDVTDPRNRVNNRVGDSCIPELSKTCSMTTLSVASCPEKLVSAFSIKVLPQIASETKDNDDSCTESVATSANSSDEKYLEPIPLSSWKSYTYFL